MANPMEALMKLKGKMKPIKKPTAGKPALDKDNDIDVAGEGNESLGEKKAEAKKGFPFKKGK